ncbi:MAG: hypothetical protein ACE5KO_04485 [Candidatus Bathyarchaeia archaeon]
MPYRLVLAIMGAIDRMPTTFFVSQLRLDCNERIVEIPFVLQQLVSPHLNNVYIVGSSVLVTTGTVEPTLAIAALALRPGSHLVSGSNNF